MKTAFFVICIEPEPQIYELHEYIGAQMIHHETVIGSDMRNANVTYYVKLPRICKLVIVIAAMMQSSSQVTAQTQAAQTQAVVDRASGLRLVVADDATCPTL